MKSPGEVGALSTVHPTDFVLPATDNYPLAARLWADSRSRQPIAAALINAGAGIGLRYYDRFAQFLALSGVPTLIYDYRGIGQSRPRSLRGFAASVEEWGSKDCAAALAWLAREFPGARRVVIGHSVGGLVTGFVTNGQMIDRMLLIGAHTGYWRDYAAKARPGMYLLWHTLMPAVTRVVGFFPGRKLRLLEDLPSGVALEWANRRRPDFWWDRTTPEGAPDSFWKNYALSRFHAIQAQTLAIYFSDDVFATKNATDRILSLYQNCEATMVMLTPAVAGGQKVGHFGFFRSRFSDSLWPPVSEWLRTDKIPAELQGRAQAQTARETA